MSYQSKVTFKDAVQNGHTIWDLFISDWGAVQLSGSQPIDLRFPPLTGTGADQMINNIFGIRIGPYSAVDAVLARFQLPNSQSQVVPISVHAPIQYPLIGPITLYAGETVSGAATPIPSVGAAPRWERIYDEVALLDGTLTAFSTAAFSRMRDTTLHIQFLLRDVPWPTPMERNPYYDWEDITVGQTEEVLAIWPTWGRRRATVTYAIFSSAGSINVRTTGLIPLGGGNGDFTEIPLTGAVNTVVPNGNNFGGIHHALDNLNVQFVLARAAKVTGGTETVTTSIWAEDQ